MRYLPEELPTPEMLGNTFARFVTEGLTEREREQLKRDASDEINPYICHSHDYCDANQAMLDAFAFFGLEYRPNVDETEMDTLWRDAWELAKLDGFDVSGFYTSSGRVDMSFAEFIATRKDVPDLRAALEYAEHLEDAAGPVPGIVYCGDLHIERWQEGTGNCTGDTLALTIGRGGYQDAFSDAALQRYERILYQFAASEQYLNG